MICDYNGKCEKVKDNFAPSASKIKSGVKKVKEDFFLNQWNSIRDYNKNVKT